ncbi:MAG: response regulator [Phyllobacterium sp.]
MLHPIRIIIADDHAIVREGLKLLLSTMEQMQVVGEATDGNSLTEVLVAQPADALILDLGMPGVIGFQFLKKIREDHESLKILILSANIDPQAVEATIRAGANGYLTKNGDPSEIVVALEKVSIGELYIEEALRHTSAPCPPAIVMSDVFASVDLTKREREILGWIAKGATARDIAEYLGISPLTVRKHRENLMKKLDLHSTAEIARYAFRIGIPVD